MRDTDDTRRRADRRLVRAGRGGRRVLIVALFGPAGVGAAC
jgi:hypothetical protein